MANTTATAATATESHSGTGSFLWSRLGSFLSLMPLGIWTVNHLWDNLAAFAGAGAWQVAVTEHPNPIAHAVTVVIVLLPLLIHAVWGLQRLFSFKPNNGAYNNYTNLKYLLQRLSAIGVLGFVGAHLWLAMLSPRLFEGHPEPFADIAREMHHHMPTLVVYLLGTLAVCYHLANGLQGFAWTWGLASGRKSLRIFDRLGIVTFLLLLAMAWLVIYALYQAGA